MEKTGGLPKYIRRIADHLIKRGMTESHAIASAVNTVKRWARGGSAAKGQKGHVNADTVAKAIAALAEWEAKKIAAKATATVGVETFARIPVESVIDAAVEAGLITPGTEIQMEDGSILDGQGERVQGPTHDTSGDYSSKPGVLKDGSAPQCSYCKNSSAGFVLHSEGMAFTPFCSEHREKAVYDGEHSTPDGSADPSNVVRVEEYVAHTSRASSLVASGGQVTSIIPVAPPTEWFKDPGFRAATPVTVTKDGRVYGHLATWDACHMESKGLGQSCVRAPRTNNDYAGFHLGYVTTAEGHDIPTGRITAGAPHADPLWGLNSTLVHYSHSGWVGADVRVGEDAYGIWVAGALRPDVTPQQLRALKAAPLSGDWREDPRTGRLELVAAHAVSTPGFQVPRLQALVASAGNVSSMQAVGLVAPKQVLKPGTEGAFSIEDLGYLKERSTAGKEWSQVAEELASIRRTVAQDSIRAFAAQRTLEELASTIKEMR